jgi:arabinogalactan endo-1,4-beta-galactosidase
MGVDISSVIAAEAAGIVYRNANGAQQDIFKTLADAGVNYIRVRVWNDPYVRDWDLDPSNLPSWPSINTGGWEVGMGYGAGNADAANAKAIGARIVAAGNRQKMLVNFHYSDFWADPGRQRVPKAWVGMTLEEKKTAIYDYTLASLNLIAESGVTIGMVQIGNEINGGMSGETYPNVYELLKKAGDAVRKFNTDNGASAKVVIHYTDPQNVDGHLGRANNLASAGVDYDIFATSYYPRWHGIVPTMSAELKKVKDAYPTKDVMVTEHGVSAYSTGSVTVDKLSPGVQYPETVQGQANAARDVIAASADAGGIGYFVYEGAWIDPGYLTDAILESSGYGVSTKYVAVYDAPNYTSTTHPDTFNSMFASDGRPLASLNVYKYVYTGAKDVINGDYIEYIAASSALVSMTNIANLAGAMPSTVTAYYASGKTEQVSVTWDATDLSKATSVGSYIIGGYAVVGGKRFDTACNLKLDVDENFIKNPGLEDADMSTWTIVKSDETAFWHVERQTADVHSGAYGLHFSMQRAASFTMEQEVTVATAGIYHFGMFAQGAGADTGTMIYVKDSSDEILESVNFSLTGWVNWQSPSLNVTLSAGDTITVGVKVVDADGGAWGTLDDFLLWKE